MMNTVTGEPIAANGATPTIDDYLQFRRSLLPREKMQAVAEQASAYRAAARFPHAAFDDFFDPVILDSVLSEFPGAQGIDWQRYDDPRFEVKLASRSERQVGLFGRPAEEIGRPHTTLFQYRPDDELLRKTKLDPRRWLRSLRQGSR